MHMDGTAGLVAQSLPSGMDRVELKDPVENIAPNLVRQAAAKTNDLACDRTITSVVLAQGLINEGVKVVAAGANPVLITCGMEKTTRALLTLMRLVVPFIMIQTPLL